MKECSTYMRWITLPFPCLLFLQSVDVLQLVLTSGQWVLHINPVFEKFVSFTAYHCSTLSGYLRRYSTSPSHLLPNVDRYISTSDFFNSMGSTWKFKWGHSQFYSIVILIKFHLDFELDFFSIHGKIIICCCSYHLDLVSVPILIVYNDWKNDLVIFNMLLSDFELWSWCRFWYLIVSQPLRNREYDCVTTIEETRIS